MSPKNHPVEKENYGKSMKPPSKIFHFWVQNVNFPGCMVFEGILKLPLDPIIMVQWKMAGICQVTNYSTFGYTPIFHWSMMGGRVNWNYDHWSNGVSSQTEMLYFILHQSALVPSKENYCSTAPGPPKKSVVKCKWRQWSYKPFIIFFSW